MNWFRRQCWKLRLQWKWLRMSKEEKSKARAFQKLLSNLMAKAPIDKIKRGESCSWDITPKQTEGVKEALETYVAASK